MPDEIFRSDDLVVRSECEFGSPACVITFDAYTDDRGFDRLGFGEAFFRYHCVDAVHFLGRENDWYQYAEMPAAAAVVAKRVCGYDRVVSYGSSMGAYAAIRFGGMAGASEALAISPQFSIDPRAASFERRWQFDSRRIDFTPERSRRAPFTATSFIAYDPNDTDKRHVDLFRPHTRVIDMRLPDVGHPATGALGDAGVLTELVLDFAAGKLNAHDIVRRTLDAHQASPLLHYVKSSRGFSRRARLDHARRAVEMSPRDFGYLLNLGSQLAANSRFDEAQIVFARAATILPDHPVLLYNLTEFHERRGDLESAIEGAEILVSRHSQTYQPVLDRLRAQRYRRAGRFRWPHVTIRGRKIIGDPSLPIDVRVTTTPAPPPFVESWRLHEAAMQRAPSSTVDVFLVGDSLAEYWPDAAWGELRVFNFGVRADKTQHAIWRLEQLPAASIDCRHAVIFIGTNNLGAGDTAAGIAAGVAAVVAAVVRVSPEAKVWVIATPPCGPDQKFRNATRRETNERVMAFEGFETVDLDRLLLSCEGNNSYLEDGIHFSQTAYERLTRLMADRLVSASEDR
jgi:tetratricopeptide (TPR) repeat protein